jgi:peroxiredoxin
MKKKALCFQSFFFVLVLSVLFSSAEGIEGLFQKVEIKPIKGFPVAPPFNLEDLKGKRVDLKQFKGQVVFLNFWATWCGPCKEEMPSMEALYQKFKERGFVFLTISVDYEETKKVKEFILKHRYTFPVLIDSKCQTLDLFGVKGIPTTILIDKKGRMLGRAIGPRDWNGPDMVNLLTELLER